MELRRVGLYALTAAFGLCACDGGIAPIEVAAGCPEQPLRGPSEYADEPESLLIDDFEHDSTSLPRLGGRDGAWILGSDGTGMKVAARISRLCSGRGERAGHFTGGAFASWGANWTAVLRGQPYGTAVAYDATPYSGISFWAATSRDVDTTNELRLGVTTVDVAWNGGVCTKCMDIYGTSITVQHAWQRYVVPFSDLQQDGSGEPQVELRLDKLVGVVLWPDSDFDVWIDDLRFEQ